MIFNKLKRIVNLWGNQFIFKISNKRCEDSDSVIILKLDALGDFIIWQDCAKEFKSIFENKKCVLLCNPVCKELAEKTFFFDDVITLDIKKFESSSEYRKESISYLNKLKFGTLVNSVFSRTWAMDVIASEIPASNKIGMEADESKLNLSRRLLTNNTKNKLDSIYDNLIPTTKDELMELQRNKELMIGLGNKSFKSAIPNLPKISSYLVPDFKFFIVFPGASTPLKRWSTDSFAKIINYVLSRYDYHCLICGSEEESFLFGEIISNITDKGKVLNYCGKTSIIDLIALVQNSGFVISNDTSGIHIAAASNVWGICIGACNNYGRFLPYISDKGQGIVDICCPDIVCRNCRNCRNSIRRMPLKCIINIFTRHQYLCMRMVDVNLLKDKIIKRKQI